MEVVGPDSQGGFPPWGSAGRQDSEGQWDVHSIYLISPALAPAASPCLCWSQICSELSV